MQRHNHCHSRSKALYTGYQTGDTYNDFVKTFTEAETGINKEEDLANGTHYAMLQATGYKLKGKEVALTVPIENASSNNGKGGNPWWYATGSGASFNPPQPSYGIIEVGYNQIKIECKYIKNVMHTDEIGNVTVHPFSDTNDINYIQSPYTYDTYTINYSDRNK